MDDSAPNLRGLLSPAELGLLKQLSPDAGNLEQPLTELCSKLAATGQPVSVAWIDAVYPKLKALPCRHGPLLVDCLLEIAKFHFSKKRADLALDPTDDAALIARQLKDPRRLWNALNHGAIMRILTLDYAGALEKLREALEVAEALNDTECKAKVIVNIGSAHKMAGQYDAAIETFSSALRLEGDKEKLQVSREAALGNIAAICLHVRDTQGGIAAIEQAHAGAQEPRSAVECIGRVQRENTYVRLLIEERRFEEARKQAQLAITFSSQFDSPLASNIARAAQALADIGAGHVDIGLTRLKQALDDARSGSESALSDMLIAGGRGYQLAGQADQATLITIEAEKLVDRTLLTNLKAQQRRYQRNLHNEWAGKLRAANAAQRRELGQQMLTPELLQAQAVFFDRIAIRAEQFDDETGLHVFRVGSWMRELARAMGLDDHLCSLLEIAARLHDIGKLEIPSSILKKGKDDPFTPEEWAVMKTHSEIGARIIHELSDGVVHAEIAEEIAMHHHEKWNGRGYPSGLRGAKIPLYARMLAPIDFYDATTHARCYKDPWPVQKSLDVIRAEKSEHFDPEIAELFLQVEQRLRHEHADLDGYLSAPGKDNSFIRDRDLLNRKLFGAQ